MGEGTIQLWKEILTVLEVYQLGGLFFQCELPTGLPPSWGTCIRPSTKLKSGRSSSASAPERRRLIVSAVDCYSLWQMLMSEARDHSPSMKWSLSRSGQISHLVFVVSLEREQKRKAALSFEAAVTRQVSSPSFPQLILLSNFEADVGGIVLWSAITLKSIFILCLVFDYKFEVFTLYYWA